MPTEPGPGWVALASSDEAGAQPTAVVSGGVPLVIWRGPQRRVAVFLDRCPHQDFPLSTGQRTLRGRLRCEMHGWEFTVDGRCVHAPHRTPQEIAGRCAVVVDSVERDGLVWVRSEDVDRLRVVE